MSVETFAERERAFLGPRLTWLYARWTALYLLGVFILWRLGIEALYQHPTPFYAYPRPASETFLVPAAAAGLFWLLYLAIVLATRPRPPRSRAALLVAPWLAYTAGVAGAALWLAFRPGGEWRIDAATVWADARGHLLVAGVFLAGLAGLVAALRSLRWFDAELSPRATTWFLVATVFFAFAFSAVVAMLRGGTDGIAAAYSRYQYEYISDIGFGRTIRGLFAEYVQKQEFLSMHAKVHPPGPVALLWILSYVAGREPMGLSLATMAVGSLAPIPLYFWVKDLFGKRAAVTACLVYVLVPSIVLFTATSADILFMPFVLLTLFLFWRALIRGSLLYAAAAGLLYALISLMSYSLLSLGAFFAFAGLWRMAERKHRFAVFHVAVVMFATFLVLHMTVRLWSGFDIVAAFHAAKAQFDLDQANLDLYTPRWPSWTWKFLNPLAWAYFAGIPVTVLFVWRVVRPGDGPRGLLFVFALTLLALDLLYLARGEGERSAMYFVPFLVVPAAYALDRLGEVARTLAPLLVTLAFLAFQCWLTESLFYTYW